MLTRYTSHLLPLCLLLTAALTTTAQHDHMMMDSSATMQMGSMQMDMHSDTTRFTTSSYSRNLPMTIDGSGTSWLTAESRMEAAMWHKKNTQIMLHGALWLRGDFQNANNPTGAGHSSRFDAPNWIMAMIDQRAGRKGVLSFSIMMSFDALTVGRGGYPLLFQTGESYRGVPLVDQQHPHHLFAGLSVAYTYGFTRDIDLTAYFGFPGEPCIGPPVFMHRPSAFYMPDAPISHHWQDATHITYGVGTIGFRYKIMKIEGSIFTGREPDDNRFDFDLPRFDSYAARVSVNPDKHLSLQASYAYIKSPEALHPAENVQRVTTSAIYAYRWRRQQRIDATLVYGLNIGEVPSGSILFEATYRWMKLSAYGRYEWVQKTNEELTLSGDPGSRHPLHDLTLGAAYNILTFYHVGLDLGAETIISRADAALQYRYGAVPVSAEVYLMIHPSTAFSLGQKKPMKTMSGMDM
ncbi:MAG: hypothetical protein JST76_05245 [Bacteroidetes bacterium]|nr:hypothetical protein [Bacteroidota bacterium]